MHRATIVALISSVGCVASGCDASGKPAASAAGSAAPTDAPRGSGVLAPADRARLAINGVSVADFGAAGDGTTDDTAAINAALAEATISGAPLLFPAGVYYVPSTGFRVPAHTHIRGVARGRSVIRFGGSGPLFALADSMLWYGGKQETVIEYLTLQGPYFGTSVHPTDSSIAIASENDTSDRGAAHAVLRQLDIDGFGRGISGMFLGGIISECYITRCGTGIYLSESSNATVIRDVTIYWADVGIESRGMSNAVTNCGIENNGVGWSSAPSFGVKVNGGSLSVTSTHFEGWAEGIDHAGGLLSSRSNFFGACGYGVHVLSSVYADASTPWQLWSSLDRFHANTISDITQDRGTTAPVHLVNPVLDPTGAAGISLDPANTNNSWQENGYIGPGTGGIRLRAGSLLLDSGTVSASAGISPGTPAGALQPGRIWMGSGIPDAASGNDGDFYFRTDRPTSNNERLYVKSGGRWTGLL